MTIRLNDLKPAAPETAKPTGTVQVIVKVRTAGYVPAAVKLRARISEHLFTADVEAENIPRTEKDPQVISVAVNKPLRVGG